LYQLTDETHESHETYERVLAWHWLADDGRMALSAARVQTDTIYSGSEFRGVASRGLLGSERALDSLEHAPGALVCRVEIWSAIARADLEDVTNHAMRQRRVLWMADATRVLNEFACDVAETAPIAERAAGREPDPRSWDAIVVKRRWITGKATNAELEVAWAAAKAGARAAALAAASAATRPAAWAPASAATWATDWDTSRDAALAAALAAARTAVKATANTTASAAAWAAANDAASEVAWNAAWNPSTEASSDAAKSKWNDLLATKLLALAPSAVIDRV
jgi:hypothetical protein